MDSNDIPAHVPHCPQQTITITSSPFYLMPRPPRCCPVPFPPALSSGSIYALGDATLQADSSFVPGLLLGIKPPVGQHQHRKDADVPMFSCPKLGLECEWLGQGKKPNQTIWLSHAVTSLGDRLEKLESAVSGLQSSLDTRDFEATPIRARTPSLSSANTPCGRRCSVRNVSGHDRYYGPTSFVSLMQDMAAVILASLCSAEQTSPAMASSAVAAREELLQLTRPHAMYRRVCDGSVLTSPPLVIIEAMVDPYFEMVNPHMPIWTKDGFRSLMASVVDSADASDKRAYHVCANSLVLLTLQAKSLHSRTMPSMPGTEAPAASSIDVDLIKSFIVNAKRALENVELLLLSPSLLSLQAILSLCLVAQTSLSEDVTALLFSFAVHVAKSIGLHQWSSPLNHSQEPSHNELQEKRNVMYCMLCLSRAVSWSSGWSSILPGVAVFEGELASSSADEVTHLAARVALLRLEEQVYTGLYSDEATRQSPSEIGKAALIRGRKLQDWAAEHTDDLMEDEECSTLLDCSRTELAMRFNSVQALATWPIAEDEEASRSLLDVARRSLRLFHRLWRTTSERGHCLNPVLLVASYPPVAFFELSKHVLCNQPAADDDLELLLSFSSMVHTFSEWAEDSSYISRLSSFSDIILRLINACGESDVFRQEETLPHPAAAGQQYTHALELYPGTTNQKVQTYGGDSVASSSTHSNSTPISGTAQPRYPIPEMDPVPVPEISASALPSSLGSFDPSFEGRLSPADELDAWMVDPRLEESMRTSLQPNLMNGFMLQDYNSFSLDRIEPG
ncbi:hypothetical protein AK830_g10892 [Neonectria ditissima]|uniref:Xylanolytic transcriptional activator regulatory domain-containing protein n=1 Tax=Neonectria ditissima TaxID=78410 RepID=A0A0P7B675_9HYPO|nr:hypothetical protein AK830_g10892 [Neonectria ditissima]